MKKLILLSFLLFAGCEKENCNCGMITTFNVPGYSFEARNNCSGVTKSFLTKQSIWMDKKVGEQVCLDSPW